MDHHFPSQLFPSFYNSGPPDPVIKPTGGGTWGSYHRLIPHVGFGSHWTFTSCHRTKAEPWYYTEPAPIPLFTPKKSHWSSSSPHRLEFKEHMENFYLDHAADAFGCMSNLIYENLNFKSSRTTKKDAGRIFLKKIKKNPPGKSFQFPNFKAYSQLLSDVVSDIPPELLETCLKEELAERTAEKLFSEKATGGALAFIPFSECQDDSEQGCLLYPVGEGLNCLNFHRVALQHRERRFYLDTSRPPSSVELKGPVRQISFSSLSNEHCVAVRSDHFCGVWRYVENQDPSLLQVVSTKEKASCISASPHVLGEMLVASESGSAHLWTPGKRIQKVREESSNLYFNANSQWRWCEFTAHPRVMIYADRTGAELTDIRASPSPCQSLFQISRTADCRAGERLITCRYLRDLHPFHHIVATQYTAYLLDERFPSVPMLKMDHMMRSPPMFCHISSGVEMTQVLLGSQRSQEVTLLQYSGGRMEASTSRGPPQALLRPRDSLKHLPVQIPHHHDATADRLSSPAAGLTRVQQRPPSGGSGTLDDCLCVLQLTEEGDIFYQTLCLRDSVSSNPSSQEDSGFASQKETPSMPVPQMSPEIVSETSSDEDVIGPSQFARGPRIVGEAPERIQESCSDSDASSDDSHSRRKRRNWKNLRNLEVVFNLDPKLNQENKENDQEEGENGEVQSGDASDPTTTTSRSAPTDLFEQLAPLELSDDALKTWRLWLQKLVSHTDRGKPGHSYMSCEKVKTTDLLSLSQSELEDYSERFDLPGLRRTMKECMANRSLLVEHRADSVVPFPDMVAPSGRQDDLTECLAVAWKGEEAWREWWRDHLGLNKNEKLEALKRKRRKAKDARRAKGRTPSLSSSFSSSYLTDQEYLSDSSGWGSQRTTLDFDEVDSLSQLMGSQEPRTPPPSQCDAPGPSTAQHETPLPEWLASPSWTHVSQSSENANWSWVGGSSGPVKTSHESLMEDQLYWSSQNEVTEAPHVSEVNPALSRSQTSSWGNLEFGVSQSLSNYSQSSSSSWNRPARMKSSQSSQPKKKSRMGF